MTPADPPNGVEWLVALGLPSVNVIYVLAGCALLGVSAGMIGCFAFLRKRSLLGDALSHAALPGICVAFMLTGARDPWIILSGAAVSCWIGAVSVDWIVRYTRCKEDSALGMVLSVFFGFGVLLLTRIQHSGDAAQAGLETFLFGQAAGMLARDVWALIIVGAVLCAGVALFYKEFKTLSFDPEFALAIGLPVRFIETALATLLVLAVVIGLQAVGVVLMAAMLLTPAAAARYWTNRLGVMLVLAGVFGGFSGVLGAYVSYLNIRMPTGPWMVMAVSGIFIVSVMLAPERGLAPRWRRLYLFRRRAMRENVLRTLYKFGEGERDWGGAYSPAELMRHRGMSLRVMRHALASLARDGLVRENAHGRYGITPAGLERGTRLTRLHRLWELYLTRELDLPPDHVHDDAEEIEHVLTPDLERRLLESLGNPDADPHGSTIPTMPRKKDGP